MAENLIILVAVASVVGVFFLVLFSVLARRERRALRKLKGANPSTRRVGTFQISWRAAYAVLVLVAILAVISFLPWLSWRKRGFGRPGPRTCTWLGRPLIE